MRMPPAVRVAHLREGAAKAALSARIRRCPDTRACDTPAAASRNHVERSAARQRAFLRGFTLLEVMVTVAILGILAMIALPSAQTSIQRARENELRLALREIRNAIDAYKRASDEGRIRRGPEESGYPRTLDELVSGVEDQRSPKRSKIYFLRRLPRDPLSKNASEDPNASWGKRSYASEPDAPAEGDDVFDVYSTAPGKGLNGVPYRQW